ncbi:hypothetical protein [Mycobacterium sp. NPDC006124]|uniref:hypothetical protein n=1 Tax=Mycobacterium sp. NPDC006124 TaxID=3156729 RepID=UPI0033B69495
MSDLSPEDVALLEAQVPVGLLMPADETMRLVHVTRGVVETHVGASAESVTTADGLVFWFDAGAGNLPVNRMATLNLLAVSEFSARTVPLLRGPALVTGRRGDHPDGLTQRQMQVLRREPGPAWLVGWILHMRRGARSSAPAELR